MTLDAALQSICVREETQGDEYRYYCEVSLDYFGFQGHFEEHPILPGVCQLQLVVQAVEKIRGRIHIGGFERVKFHNLIVPGTVFVIVVKVTESSCFYRICNDVDEFASGKIIFK